MYVNFLQTNYKLLVIEFIAAISLSAETFPYAPINGLPQDGGGGSGNPREFDFVRRTWVGILTSQRSPGWEI